MSFKEEIAKAQKVYLKDQTDVSKGEKLRKQSQKYHAARLVLTNHQVLEADVAGQDHRAH